MIYQLQLYYGALIGDKAIYTVDMAFNDCTKPFTTTIDIEPYKQELIKQILQDGFNPSDFRIDWLTKEQYENKVESKVVKNIKI